MNGIGKHLRTGKLFVAIASILTFTYATFCLFLFARQRHFIYRPKAESALLPSASAFNLPYEDVWISIANSNEKLHGWWIPAPSVGEEYQAIRNGSASLRANEPINILKSPKVMLYFCGVGRNMGDYNYLARGAAFRQLGFSVLVVDYRGYGQSKDNFPSESQVYQDAEAAWNYSETVRQIPPQQILIYGESLGGAIALNLAVTQPEAGGLILQSTFTSMADAVRSRRFLQLFPTDWLLTERFNSVEKIRSLQIPVLFLHGWNDSVVPAFMSQQLYDAAPHPKQLFFIAGADHVRIYQPADRSYLRAIQRFVESLP